MSRLNRNHDDQIHGAGLTNSLIKVDFHSRLKGGEPVCVQHHEMTPSVMLLNIDSNMPKYTSSQTQDSEVLERAFKGVDISSLNCTSRAMFEKGIDLRYAWYQSPPRAVCWYHQHRPATMCCTLTDRNFCSRSCYMAAFIQVKKIIASDEMIEIPGGINPMTHGVLNQIALNTNRCMDEFRFPESSKTITSLGINFKSARAWDLVPSNKIIWPLPLNEPLPSVSLNPELCAGFTKDFNIGNRNYMANEHADLFKKQKEQPFAIAPLSAGGGGWMMSQLWDFYRHLRALKITVTPLERNSLYWELISDNKALTPHEEHIGRELRFTASVQYREGDEWNIVRKNGFNLNNPAEAALDSIFNDDSQASQQRGVWSGNTCVAVPEGHQKLVSGSLISINQNNNPHVTMETIDHGISILSWNILADLLATEDMFHHLPPAYLKWSYRKHFILSQIQQLAPDVICLQELQNDHFLFFEEHLRNVALGYAGFYKHKRLDTFSATSALGRGGSGTYISDGCALFYNASKFQPVMYCTADYGNLISQVISSIGGVPALEMLVSNFYDSSQKALDVQKDILTRLFKNNVLQFVALETRPPLLPKNENSDSEKQIRYNEAIKYHQHCLNQLHEKCPPVKHPMEFPEIAISYEIGKSNALDEIQFKSFDEITGNVVIVGNTHILANPEVSDTKFWQTSLFMKNLDRIATLCRSELNARRAIRQAKGLDIPNIAVMICGDFNSMPGSAVYSYIINGKPDMHHPEIENDRRGLLRIASSLTQLEHRLKIRSMNAEAMCSERRMDVNQYYPSLEDQSYLKPHRQSLGLVEPVWTNSTPSFTGCLDYIFFEYHELLCTEVLRLPTQNSLYRESEFNSTLSPHLPMLNRPSDHVPIFGRFQWKNRDSGSKADNVPPTKGGYFWNADG